MSWKKIATILEIKKIPTQINGIKQCGTLYSRHGLDNISKIFNLYTIRHKKKTPSNKKSENNRDVNKYLSKSWDLIMGLIKSIKSVEPEHKKQKIESTKKKQLKKPRTHRDSTITTDSHNTGTELKQMTTFDRFWNLFFQKTFQYKFQTSEIHSPQRIFLFRNGNTRLQTAENNIK